MRISVPRLHENVCARATHYNFPYNSLSPEKSLPIHSVNIFKLHRWFLIDDHIRNGKEKIKEVTILCQKYPLWDLNLKGNDQ